MRLHCYLTMLLFAVVSLNLSAETLEPKPDDAFFAKFNPVKAPTPAALLIKTGDRLAICGDSITEQKMYSRAIETYLTACTPHLDVEVRQYGWGGETAEGFLGRMTNDCLRFSPTLATTCYGMNDHRYTTYSESNGKWYISNQQAIVRAFKAAGARVVLGSAGCVGSKVPWAKGSSEDMNLNLLQFRNHDIQIASDENVGFADVFWPMFTAGHAATLKYGDGYNIAGGDGVHPGWSGHLIMAYAFLKSLGLDGDLGTFTVDLAAGKAEATSGHSVVGFNNGELQVKSTRYPFCAPTADVAKDDNIRSAWTLVPFNEELNRLRLVVRHASDKNYKVTWGAETRTYSGEQLGKGINLAAEFIVTPFNDAFKKVDDAVGKKQSYETRQIKTLFHGEEGKADMTMTAALTEKARAPLVTAVHKAMVPITHTVKIEATP